MDGLKPLMVNSDKTDVLWCSTSQTPSLTPLSPAGTIRYNRQSVSVGRWL